MTETTLLVVAVAGLVITGLSGTATKVLHGFSRRELETYCGRRKRLDRFGEILDEDEQARLGVESLQVVGTVLLVLAGAAWCFQVVGQFDRIGAPRFLAGVAVGWLVLLALTAWVPRAVLRLWAAPFVYHTWPLWKVVYRLLWPLTLGVKVVDALMRRLADRPEKEQDEEEAFEEEIRSIVTEGIHEGLLEQDAREMIEGVIELADADVSDIMTPRINVDALDVELSWPEVIQFVVEAGRTRIPVYERTLDQIVGILYVKDLLSELSNEQSESRTPLRELLRDAWFVPTTKPLDEMLQEFLKTRNHLAVVVDEYRSVAGVVTIEDVLEEIVGEIVDEYDKEEEELVKRIDERAAEVRGITHVAVVNQRLGLDLPEPDEYDTIAGLVISHLGHLPKEGESVVVDGARITVLEATRRRVDKLRIEVGVSGEW